MPIPSIDQLTTNRAMTIDAVSSLTGKHVKESVVPIPTTPSLWALDGKGPGVVVKGSRFKADGLVHSESAVRVSGAGSSFTGGAEYATTWSQQGGSVVTTPAPLQVVAQQGRPAGRTIADYLPGGQVAKSGVGYTAVPQSQCVGGVWHPQPGLSGVFYAPCSVVIDAPGVYPATIAAEGRVTVTAADVTVGRSPTDGPGEPSIVTGASGEAVAITAADTRMNGQIVAAGGSVRVAGARATLTCGAVASSISVDGSDSSALMATRCLGQ